MKMKIATTRRAIYTRELYALTGVNSGTCIIAVPSHSLLETVLFQCVAGQSAAADANMEDRQPKVGVLDEGPPPQIQQKR